MIEKRFWLVPLEYEGECRFVRDNSLIGEKSLSNKEVVDLLNHQQDQLDKFENTLKEAIQNECMTMSKNALKQLADRLGVEY